MIKEKAVIEWTDTCKEDADTLAWQREHWKKLNKEQALTTTKKVRILYNKDNTYVAMIHKCGTSTLSKVLEEEQNWEAVTSVPNGTKVYTLVRDPVDRWISGMTQDICYWYDFKTFIDNVPSDVLAHYVFMRNATPQFLLRYIETHPYGNHTTPMQHYLKGLDVIPYDLKNIKNFLEAIGSTPTKKHVRNHKDLGLQGTFYKELTGKIYNFELQHAIRARYSDDQKLFDKCIKD